ncbi:MAG: CDP-glycerol glycerophosphotransferase family protein [Candidatus Adiutrix sp.]|jgi:YidC/Oxa1 family membrane protein insertase|nr:CDP-glycerol glycerophosphotransferase family protein [Candidatus Adiutrix sp.]
MSFLKSMASYLKLRKEKIDIIFYSEGKSYWINFRDIIKSLTEDHQRLVHYVTSSADDPVLERAGEFFRPFYIGNEFFRILFFNNLRAKTFLTTLPDIDTFHLKRSAEVERLVYVHHTLGSMNMIFLPGAFDSYDVIMCSSPHQLAEAREMEAFYHKKAKKLIPAGYPPLDDLTRRLEAAVPPGNARPVVTIAPSWQPDNIIDRVGEPLINSLLAAGFQVKLRPHPRTLQLEMKKVLKLIEAYQKTADFAFDDAPGSFDSYLGSDLMVTDWSGTAIKFAFSRLRPVLFINTPPKARNKDYLKFENAPVELSWRNIIGRDLSEDDIRQAGTLALEMHGEASWPERLKLFREANVYNLGRGGQAIAEAIIEL